MQIKWFSRRFDLPDTAVDKAPPRPPVTPVDFPDTAVNEAPPRPPVTPVNVMPRPIAAQQQFGQYGGIQPVNDATGMAGAPRPPVDPDAAMKQRAFEARQAMRVGTFDVGSRSTRDIRAQQAQGAAYQAQRQKTELEAKGEVDYKRQLEYLQAKNAPAVAKAQNQAAIAAQKQALAERVQAFRETDSTAKRDFTKETMQKAHDYAVDIAKKEGKLVGTPEDDEKIRKETDAKLEVEKSKFEDDMAKAGSKEEHDFALEHYKALNEMQLNMQKENAKNGDNTKMAIPAVPTVPKNDGPTPAQQQETIKQADSYVQKYPKWEDAQTDLQKRYPNATPEQIQQAKDQYDKMEYISKKAAKQKEKSWDTEMGW